MPSFAISQFIILLEPLWAPADFLLLSTGSKTNVKYTGRQQTKLGEQSIVYIDNSWKSVYTQNQGTKDAKKKKTMGGLLTARGKILIIAVLHIRV